MNTLIDSLPIQAVILTYDDMQLEAAVEFKVKGENFRISPENARPCAAALFDAHYAIAYAQKNKKPKLANGLKRKGDRLEISWAFLPHISIPLKIVNDIALNILSAAIESSSTLNWYEFCASEGMNVEEIQGVLDRFAMKELNEC